MELPIPDDLKKMAKDLNGPNLPNVFLGELQEFNWGLELCELPGGRPGIRLIIIPALIPFIKFSLAFHVLGLENLADDIQAALHKHYEQTQIPRETEG